MRALLQAANGHLSEIIRLINASLADLQKAKKDNLAATSEGLKRELAGFVAAKKALDQKLLLLAQQNPEKDLSELLSDAEQEQLKLLRINLASVQERNSEYAALVMSLKDFYDELTTKMLGIDDNYSQYFQNKL